MRPLCLLLVTALVSAVHAQPDREAAFAADADAFIAETLEAAGVIPGLAVAVVRGDEVVYQQGFGYADREAGLEATPHTPFYIASATKPFTALAAALLAHEGALRLDATLADLFPDVVFDPGIPAGEVTVRHLLSHTAGLDNGPIGFRAAYTGEHTPEVMRRLLAETVVEEDAPLGAFEYTNVGYNILSLHLDAMEGGPWQDLLASRIFAPLGMHRTTAYASEGKAWGHAAPYAVGPEGPPARLALQKHDDTMQAAGGMLASAHDLARWLVVHLNEGRLEGQQVLPAEVVAEAHRPVAADRGESFGPFGRDGYALGWQTGRYRDRPQLHHFGGFAGFHAHHSFLPEDGLGVVVLANEADAAGRIVPLIASFLYDWWLLGPEAAAGHEAARDDLVARIPGLRERLAEGLASRAARTWQLSLDPAAYAGTYVNPSWGTMEVGVEGGVPVLRYGRLHAAGTPFTEPETVRVELVPGRGMVVGFEVEGGRAVGLRFMGERFERADA